MLFQAFHSPSLQLKNRIVMAPLTRSRAVENNTPNELMAQYYGQRAGAGLIVTEGTSPSPNGLGYPRIPGLFNAEQVAGWKPRHRRGARPGRQDLRAADAHRPCGARRPTCRPAPRCSARPTAALAGEMYTDAQGMQPHSHAAGDDRRGHRSTPIDEYVHAARLAIEAGFDGVELHAANGYLMEQFLNANVNTRDRRLRRLGRKAQPLRAGGGARHGGRDRRRARRHPAVALWRVQRHGRLRRRRGAVPGAGARTRRAEAGLPAPGRPFVDGRARSAGRLQGPAALGLRRQLHRLGRLRPRTAPNRR